MPLPSGTPLSLQGHSRPGDTVQTKPKHAMIVRMSAETLEALEDLSSSPVMNFEFGDNPGIYIGETFFPMRPLKESSPHEIYLRTSSAAKPNAPLKLYANVMGKFIVDRQLGEKVTDKVRQQTIEAKKQHAERQTIMLDAPLVSAAGTKNLKRKTPGSGTVVKKAAQRDTLRAPAASTPVARKISPMPQAASSKANADIRRRLIHFLAVESRETDLTVSRVCGRESDVNARANLLSILEEVAEQTPARKGDKSPRKWELKQSTWLEVRPYEWEMYKPSERTVIARQGRVVLSSLKIPESDSVWDHFRFRNVAPPTGAAPHPTHGGKTITGPPAGLLKPKPEPKRPAISKDLKQKAKADSSRTKGDIQMKDESARPRGGLQMKDESVKLPRVAAIKREEASPSPSSSTSTSSKAASRRLPGSGYVAKKSPQPSPAVETASREAAGSANPRPQRPLPRLPPKPTPVPQPPLPSQEKTPATSIPMKMTKKMLPPEDSDRERERHRDKDRPPKDRVVAGVKRKNATHDVGDAQDGVELKANTFKKRRTEEGPSPVASSSSLKGRDLSLPKKPVEAASPVPPPPKKIKKEPSPLPLPLPQPRTALPTQPLPPNPASKTDQRPKLNGASKSRRRSPIYTSSDEGEISEPPRKSVQDPPTNTDRSKGKEGRARPRASYPLPPDRNGLRSRYQSKYGHYLGTYSQIVAQKRKIEAILNGESEAEGEIMDPEELKRLSTEHKSQKEELEFIQEKWMNGSVSE